MTIPSSADRMQNPVRAHKFKNYHQKAKGMSFFAFLFSVVIYISIFYIFSLTPSAALFNNPKFWFVISNTLILIIAADYGAFSSSSKEKRDVYEEYALHRQARSTVASSFVSQYPEIVKKSIPKEDEEISSKEKKEDITVAAQKNESHETPERIVEVVKIEPAKSQQEHEQPMKADSDDHQINNKTEPKTIRRSKSDKGKRATFHDDKKNILQRSETEKHEPITAKDQNDSPAEENEFSTMSDEELNRRVEEFIQNFNRQIRLQGARNRQHLEFE